MARAVPVVISWPFPANFELQTVRNLLESAKTVPESRRAVPDPTQISTDPVAGMIDLGTILENSNDADELSKLLAERAGSYLLIKNYDATVNDCDNALRLNQLNVRAYIHKTKALVQMKRTYEADIVIKKARTLFPEHLEVVHFQCDMANAWFTAGHAVLKSFASLGIGILVGLMVNKFSTYSPVTQGLIASTVTAFIFFVNLRRVLRFFSSFIYTSRVLLFHLRNRLNNWFARLPNSSITTNIQTDTTSTTTTRF
ncbi:unnamed protein product [Adineta ricciae]|uniref:Uncharacterized protein n=1 Tax=Adineta ricciae TaxID=249248 RepID=A0A816A075_ADIRI|nr:unnamed protein product [Adineta ricciae]CAF1590242.1 unnamed protein product [Adineta ricciae]